ncbi:hypothetical protein QR680_012150 [Steinernema hermaphroditum]|uniref:Uncharacterized protein n=1 Tax=Steinernema hermaphroditum TaxID=289476 RepID=A0AA39I126_9BILA|nr:hypothetical protein QR680_012150 [Steinernema hermaphroditum]
MENLKKFATSKLSNLIDDYIMFSSGLSCIAFFLMATTVSSMVLPSEAASRTVFSRSVRSYPPTSWAELDPTCAVYKNDALHDIMDRVCMLCHEMFSHQIPDLRANCRATCFKNEQFRACLSLFQPPKP